MFNNLKFPQKYKRTLLNVDNFEPLTYIEDGEKIISYQDTKFYDFDQYLVASLRNELQPINVDGANCEDCIN